MDGALIPPYLRKRKRLESWECKKGPPCYTEATRSNLYPVMEHLLLLLYPLKLIPVNMLRILIADDHAIVRKGLKQILFEEFPFAEIGETDNAEELINMALTDKWDVVICD